MKTDLILTRFMTACLGVGSSLLFLGGYYVLVDNQEFKRSQKNKFGEISNYSKEVYLRPSNALMWKGILNLQDVFQKDVIKTGSESSVNIQTPAGDKINISEMSLVVLEQTPKGPEITLKNGSLNLSGVAKLVSHGEEIAVDGAISAYRNEKSGSVELIAEKGKITLTDKEGTKSLVSEGESLSIDKNGKSTVRAFPLKRAMPAASEEVTLNSNKKSLEFSFSKITGNFSKEDKIAIQISANEDFSKAQYIPLAVDNLKKEIQLEEYSGKVFWRAYSLKTKEALSTAGHLSIINPTKWNWRTPEQYRFATVDKDGISTNIQWEVLAGVESYTIQITNPSKELLYSLDRTTINELSWQKIKNDLFEKLVLGKDDYINSEMTFSVNAVKNNKAIASLDTKFRFLDKRPPEAPSITSSKFLRDSPKDYYVEWNKVRGATGYEINLSNKQLATAETNYKISIEDIPQSNIIQIRSIRQDLLGEWTNIKVNKEKLSRQIAFIEPVFLKYPLNNSRVISDPSKQLKIEWETNAKHKGHIKHFIFELIHNGKTVKTTKTDKQHIQLEALNSGKYTWKIKAVFKDLGEGDFVSQQFRVIKGAGLNAPQWKD